MVRQRSWSEVCQQCVGNQSEIVQKSLSSWSKAGLGWSSVLFVQWRILFWLIVGQFPTKYWATTDQLLVMFWPTVDQRLTTCWPHVDYLMTKVWPCCLTIFQNWSESVRQWNWLEVGHEWSNDGQQLINRLSTAGQYNGLVCLYIFCFQVIYIRMVCVLHSYGFAFYLERRRSAKFVVFSV